MFKKLIILVILLLAGVPVFAQQVDTAWVRRYNGPGNSEDRALAIAVDGSGNVYVTGWSSGIGTSNDYATLKYDPNGDTAWVRRYNGPGDSTDYAYAIAVDGSGNVYVTGQSYGSGTSYDYATLKYDPQGNTLWEKRYNGPGNSGDYAYAIAVDGSGNVYVTGQSYGSGTNSDYATIKYYPNGDTAWVRRYNGPVNDRDVAFAIAVDGSGNVYVTGQSWGSGTSYDYATLKYDPQGNQLWEKRYNGTGNYYDWASDIAVDGSANVYVTGRSEGSGTYSDYATIKYYPNGDTAWVRRYNGPVNYDDEAQAIAVDGSGNIYVTGGSYSFSAYDYASIKYYPNGDTAWVRRYNGPADTADYAYAITVDGSNNVYVTGYSYGWPQPDYATVKYDSTGNELWVKRYNGPGNYDDDARAIAVDGSGNVYATGRSYGSGTNYDYATIKYVPLKQRNDTLSYFAYSPVDLIVTDPVGDSIGLGFNTIPNASYDTTMDINHDGDKDDKVTIPNPIVGEYMVRVVRESPTDTGHYTLAIKLDGNEGPAVVFSVPGPGEVDTFSYDVTEYLKGDANTDGKKSVSDVIYLINYLFKGGPPPECPPLPYLSCSDVNCDDKISVSDVVYLINYLFKGGPAPCT